MSGALSGSRSSGKRNAADREESILPHRDARGLHGIRRVVNLPPVQAAAPVGGVQQIALDQEVFECAWE